MPADPVSFEGPRAALILFGSETGNAQDVAEELGRLMERLHFLTRISDMNSIDISALSEYTIVLFAISTTGQGELPANARTLWKSLLRRRLPSNYMHGVEFTTFGLGDSSYPKFNWAVRKLHKRLVQLGALEVYPRGEADEQHPEGLDGSFLPWSIDLRRFILRRYPLPEFQSPIPDNVLLQPKWALELDQGCAARNTSFGDTAPSPASTSTQPKDQSPSPLSNSQVPPSDLLPGQESFKATLTRNDRITPTSHWQDVRQLTLVTEMHIQYLPGDTLTIFPKNFPEDVEQLISLMDWQSHADKPIHFVPTNSSAKLRISPPPPILHLLPYPRFTLRSLLTNYLDITSIPRRSFFSLIAHFTDDMVHKERLLEFTNPEYTDELYDYTTRPRRSILEVLQEFQSVKIPWCWVGAVLPVLRGRQFSIASGGSLKSSVTGTNPHTKFELLVAIVKYRTVIKKIRQGVCTRYLAALPVGTQMNVLLQRGGLDIAKAEATRPVVMIAPGTGVAPMRSLIWERLTWAKQLKTQRQGGPLSAGEASSSTSIGHNVLFFGCRNKDADYFFKHEWDDLKSRLDLEIFTAFSRDQRGKIYVQNLVREQSSIVYRLLHEQQGIVYICGSSGKMPQAVREALIEVFQKEGDTMDRESAEAYLLSMEKQGRYRQETW